MLVQTKEVACASWRWSYSWSLGERDAQARAIWERAAT